MLALSPPRLALRRAVSAAAVSVASPSPPRSRRVVDTTAATSSLAQSHPPIAAQWVKAGTNALASPNQVDAASVLLVSWTCTHCKHVYKRRVRDQVHAAGECPACGKAPATSSVVAAKMSPKKQQHEHSSPSPPSPRPPPAAAAAAKSTCDALAAGKVINPMLAQNWEEFAHLIPDSEELLISPKLDGIRCIVAWDSRSKSPVFLSRKGTVFECADHLVPFLKPLFLDDPTLVLDGELYNHSLLALDFEMLSGAVKTTRAHVTPEVAAVQKQLQYHVFDVMHSKHLAALAKRGEKVPPQFAPSTNTAVTAGMACEGSGMHVPFSARYATLKTKIIPMVVRSAAKQATKRGATTAAAAAAAVPIVLVPHVPTKKARIKADLDKALARRYEGLMVRRRGAGYAFGKRSPYLLKYKVMKDAEYEIVGFVEGKGKLANSLGAMLCQTKDGTRFTVSPSITEDMRRQVWRKQQAYLGKMLTVQFQGLSVHGVPRFPIGKGVRGLRDGSDWV